MEHSPQVVSSPSTMCEYLSTAPHVWTYVCLQVMVRRNLPAQHSSKCRQPLIVSIHFMSSWETLVSCSYTAVSTTTSTSTTRKRLSFQICDVRLPMPLVPLVSQFDHGGQLKHWSVTFSCTSLMKIFDPSTKSWRQHFLPEMGTMAAWFGCLIIIQLFLFLSKIFSYHTINLNHKWAWSCLQHALSNCKRVKIKLPLIEKLIYAFI